MSRDLTSRDVSSCYFNFHATLNGAIDATVSGRGVTQPDVARRGHVTSLFPLKLAGERTGGRRDGQS